MKHGIIEWKFEKSTVSQFHQEVTLQSSKSRLEVTEKLASEVVAPASMTYLLDYPNAVAYNMHSSRYQETKKLECFPSTTKQCAHFDAVAHRHYSVYYGLPILSVTHQSNSSQNYNYSGIVSDKKHASWLQQVNHVKRVHFMEPAHNYSTPIKVFKCKLISRSTAGAEQSITDRRK